MTQTQTQQETLQQVIDRIGGNSEMHGTPLSAECLTETATLVATRGGYEIYKLESGGYWLSADDGSTWLVDDEMSDLSTDQARVIGAATRVENDQIEVVFDGGGGILVILPGYVHAYDDGVQAALDIKAYMESKTTAGWDGDEPEFYDEYDPEIARSGGYHWVSAAELRREMSETKPLDCSGHSDLCFWSTLTGRKHVDD